jgi:prolyl-tRNA editing enzyme YbaK/EbsC (Cys-tRNA(Pro) deacylase)
MTSSDLAAFIAANNITAEIIRLGAHTPTVEAAAQVLGVQVEQVGKSILFMADDKPVLVIASGINRIDYKRLADYLGLSRRRIRIANPEEVETIAGFVVGSMPPFGHKTKLRTLMDARTFEQSLFYAGGGDIDAMLRVAPSEIERVAQAEKVEVTNSI